MLQTNTLYEINGTIQLSKSIDLNNAYVLGLDSGEDKIVTTSGNMFSSSKGGSLKNLTLVASAGKVFDLNGSTTESLILRDLIIANSNSVGDIKGYLMVFKSVVQYLNNTNGIVYENNNTLLLSNTGWFGDNKGIYETYKGNFDFVEKQGGFMIVNGSARGIDVGSNPHVAEGVLTGVSFSGANKDWFVVGYAATQTYPGYKFSNAWNVDCPGIKVEADKVASANIYFTSSISTGFYQPINSENPVKLRGYRDTDVTVGTVGANMLRTKVPTTGSSDVKNNRIIYEGKKTRIFQASASLSVRGTNGAEGRTKTYYAFFIAKNGVPLIETRSMTKVLYTDDITSQSINGIVEMSPNDYVEIWVQRVPGSTATKTEIEVFSLNFSLN